MNKEPSSQTQRLPCPVNEFSEIATGDMPSMDSFYHFVLSRQKPGETFEVTEERLRRET